MKKTSLFVVVCALALTIAFAQQAAPGTPTPATGSAAPSASAPTAPAQNAPAQGTAPATPAQAPQAAPTPSAGSFLTGLLPIILIFVVFYFLLIMPQQRQRKKHVEMLSALKAGDKVVVLGGVHGVIKIGRAHV